MTAKVYDMKISLRKRDLKDRCGCKDGYILLDALKKEMGVPPNKVLRIRWDALSMLMALTDPRTRRSACWAMENGILPRWSVGDTADLSGLSLPMACFAHLHFRYSRLAGCDLSRADFQSANLDTVSLENAKMYGAIVHEVQMHHCTLDGADLTFAFGDRPFFKNCWFRSSVLTGAHMNSGTFATCTFSGRSHRRPDLSSSQFNYSHLHDIEFEGAYFVGCSFRMSVVERSSFEKSSLRGAWFYRARIHDTSFRQALLQGAEFENCVLTNVDFHEADLNQASFRNCRLEDVRFEGVHDLHKLNLQESVLVGSTRI